MGSKHIDTKSARYLIGPPRLTENRQIQPGPFAYALPLNTPIHLDPRSKGTLLEPQCVLVYIDLPRQTSALDDEDSSCESLHLDLLVTMDASNKGVSPRPVCKAERAIGMVQAWMVR